MRAGRLIRLAVGLGDTEREHRLLPELTQNQELVVVHRSLAADELLDRLNARDVDVALLAGDLHRLNADRQRELLGCSVPLVVLSATAEQAQWRAGGAAVVDLDASATELREAIAAVLDGTYATPAPAEETIEAVQHGDDSGDSVASVPSVIAVASAPGSPGRSTVALNLATSLGAVTATVLVDLDITAPSQAMLLDSDPTRNIYMLAHAAPETTREWDHRLQQELQPISHRSRFGRALCGVPKPEMRSTVSTRFLDELLSQLQQRYRYVVLDLGGDALETGSVIGQLALRSAGRILLVSTADVLGLWRTRMAINRLDGAHDRLAVVVNRYDKRHHHSRKEIEWSLGVPLAAILPYDRPAMERALAKQRPAVLDRKSRAGRGLLDLAARLHGDRLFLPLEEQPARRRKPHNWRWPALPRILSVFRRPAAAGAEPVTEQPVLGQPVRVTEEVSDVEPSPAVI